MEKKPIGNECNLVYFNVFVRLLLLEKKKRVHLTRKLLSLSGLCVLHIVLKWGRKNRWFLEKVASTQSNHYYHYHHRSRRNEWFFIGHHGFFFAIATFVLMINIIFVAPPNLKFVAFWTKGKRTQRRAQASCSNSRSFCWRLEVRCFENHRKEQPFFQPSLPSNEQTPVKKMMWRKRGPNAKNADGGLHLACVVQTTQLEQTYRSHYRGITYFGPTAKESN